MKEALFYKKLAGKKVQCQLCPRFCTVAEGKRGFCGVRKNIKGKLYSLVYGKLCSINADPVEKKPLFHWSPGTSCLSICTVGCNLDCQFCQNWTISHPPGKEILGEEITAERVIEITKENNLPGIAYTYTEPLIALEFYLEVMKLARKAGLYNVWVSNGYTNPEPAKKAAKYLDAINVDLKGDIKFYQKLCAVPNEDPMKKALKIYKKNGVWIEVTNLVIPGYNDKKEQVEKLVLWVKENMGTDTPLHFSRFYPHRKMTDVSPTDVKTLEMAVRVAEKAGMNYVYLGNVPGHPKENTYCPKCGTVMIKRSGLMVNSIKEKCPKCNTKIRIAGRRWLR